MFEDAAKSHCDSRHYIAPQRWHRILHEALRVRSGGTAQYASVLMRKQDALDYIDYIIAFANTEYPTAQSSTVPAK